MKTTIYYFSGTGNSLHVSRVLAKILSDTTLIPITAALKFPKIETEADIVGMIFPIYAFSIPEPVKQFLTKTNFKSASYVFAISTRGCSSKVFRYINSLLSNSERTLDAFFSVQMAENYLPMFRMPSPDEISRMESQMLSKLESVRREISAKNKIIPKDNFSVFLLANTLFPLLTFLNHKTKYSHLDTSLYSNSECDGCKVCEEVCLGDRIRVKSGLPEWDKEKPCTFCLACIHYCPCKAIQIRNRRTDRKNRYHHPEVDYKDIAEQKIPLIVTERRSYM